VSTGDSDWDALEKEFLVGRAQEIGERIRRRWVYLTQKRSPGRVQETLQAQEAHPSAADVDVASRALIANMTASQENLIIALATTLAELDESGRPLRSDDSE
jgi:RPA family protein